MRKYFTAGSQGNISSAEASFSNDSSLYQVDTKATQYINKELYRIQAFCVMVPPLCSLLFLYYFTLSFESLLFLKYLLIIFL